MIVSKLFTKTSFAVITAILVVAVVHSCRTVKPLQGRKAVNDQRYDSVIVDKNGNSYSVKRLRDHLWLTANMSVIIPGSYYFNDSIKHGKQYGRLYTWDAAKAGCALVGDGWRLPGKEEWQALAELYGVIGREEANIMKRAYQPLLTGGTANFNAVLGGGRNPDGSYARLEAHGFYWTATGNDNTTAWFVNFAKGSQALYIQPEGEKVRAFSVRCVKDKPILKQ